MKEARGAPRRGLSEPTRKSTVSAFYLSGRSVATGSAQRPNQGPDGGETRKVALGPTNFVA